MALLGTLSLDLSAPTAQLSRDLERAQQMAREAASKMSGIKPVWGIASSLQDEMRASRSILNSSLKAIETDAKGYRPLVRVGVDFDNGAIGTQMQSLEREFSQRSAYLNRQVITPQVNDSQLTALNKHLSIKEQHLDRVVSKFKNTRIAPSIDDYALIQLEQRLNNIEHVGGKAKVSINPGDIGNIDGHIDKLGKKLDKLKPASGLFSAVTFAPAQIATGYFQGLGKKLSTGLGEGYNQGVEAALGDTIGSTELLGRKLAESIATRTRSSISRLVPTAITDGIKNSINQALGESEVFVESRSRQAVQSEGQQARKSQSRKGVAEERRQAARDYEDRGFEVSALTTRSSQLERSYQANSRVKNIVDDKIASRPEGSRSRAKLEAISASFEFDQHSITEEQIKVGKQLRSSKNAFQQSERRVDRSNSVYQALKPTQLPKAYEDAIANVPEDLIPQLKADPKLAQRGADASYSAKTNRLKVSPEIYRSMQNGSMSQDQFRIMYHEIQHGRDFKFGQFDGLVDRENLKVRNPVKATAQDIKDVAPYISQYKSELRLVEQNAEISGRKRGGKAYERQQRQVLGAQLTKTYGLGGIKLDRVVNNQIDNASSRASAIDNFGANLGHQSPSAGKITDRAIEIGSRQKQIGLDIAKASNGELSSSEIEELQRRIEKQLLGLEHLSTRIDAVKRSIVKRIVKAKQSTLQSADATISDPWATSKPRGLVIDRDKIVQAAASAGQALKQTVETSRAIVDGTKVTFNNVASGAKASYGLMQRGEALLMNVSPQARLLKSQVKENIGNKIADTRYRIAQTAGTVGQFAGMTYQGLKAVEAIPLGLLPGGYTAKKLIQNVAVPTALYGAAHTVPGLSTMLDAASGGIHALAGGAGHLLSSGATNGLADIVSQSLASVPFHESVVPAVQQGLGGTVEALITGGAETAATLSAPILIGKSLSNAATGSVGFGLKKLARINPLLKPAQAPPKLEAAPELEYVEAQSRRVDEDTPARSLSQEAARDLLPRIPGKKEVASPVEVSQPKIISEITEADAIDRASQLAQSFQKAQKSIKEALKKGDLKLAFGMSQRLESYAQGATKEIASITDLLGDKAAFGTKLGSQLANAKSQIAKARNTGIRATTVYQSNNSTTDATPTGDELTALRIPKFSEIKTSVSEQLGKFEKLFSPRQGADPIATPSIPSVVRSVTLGTESGSKGIVQASPLNPTPIVDSPLGRQIPQPTSAKSGRISLGSALPPPSQIIPESAARSLSQSDLTTSIEQRLSYFDSVYPQAEKQVRNKEKRGRKNVRTFIGDVDNHQELFDSSFSRLDRKSAKNLTEQTAKTQNLNDRVFTEDGIVPLGKSADSVLPKLSDLAEVGKLALGTFGAFTALSLGVPAMISLGKSAFDTATNFERLQVKMASASDSAQSGKQKFAQLSSTADNLGISRSSALETGAYIGGTTFGTQLDGAPSDAITKQILQVAQARGLGKQETDGLNLAVGQTLGRSRTSAQEINQLTQSAGITDARAIAARGLGMTAAQFSQVQDSPTGIDSKRFVQAFLTQAVQDSQSGKSLAQDSVVFKQGQLGAATERTAGNLGAPMMPVVKLALDGLNSALKLFNDGLERSSGLLMGLAVGGIAAIGIQAMTSGTALNSVLGMTANTIRTVGSAAFGVLPPLSTIGVEMLKLGATMAGMAIAGEVVRQVFEITKNQSQDLSDSASKIGEATRESGKEKSKPKEGEKQNTSEIGGRDWGESAILVLQRGVKVASGGRTVDNKEKESNDRKIAASEIIVNSNQQMLKTADTIKSAQSVTQIDLDLARIDTERSGLFSSGNPDGAKLATLDTEYQKKTGERQKVVDNITPQKTDLQNAINANKGGIAKLNKELADGQVTRPEYDEQLKAYNQTIKSLESSMRDLNAAIRSSFDNLQPWLTTLSKIVAKFEDIGVAANTSRERFATSRNSGETSGKLTRGGSERQAVSDNDLITSEEIKARKTVIDELKGSLGNLDRKNVATVQKAYGLTDGSSSAQIKIAAGNATSVNDKTTLEKLATIKEEQLKVASLDATLSNSHAETYRRIYAENREAALYYTQLSQQIDPKGTMFAKNISAITAEKARFMAKLSNYGTGGFDVYTTAIIDLMDVAKERMTALAKLAADKKAAIDGQANRNNDIAGKRQNDFDTTPGAQQPAVGKVSGMVQKSGINAPQPGSSTQSVSTSAQAPSTEPPLPPKTIKVKRTKTFADASGYTDSPNPKVQARIRTKLANGGYSPTDVDRYVNTTQAIGSRTYDNKGKPTGYTDLGLDEFDRKVLGLNDRGKPQGIPISTSSGKQLRSPGSAIDSKPRAGSSQSTKPQGSKITVNYEQEVPNPEYKKAVDAQNKRRAADQGLQSGANQITPQAKGGRLTTGELRDKSQIASDRIAQEALDRSNATFSEFEPGEALKQNQIRLKLDRESRLAQQAAAKQLRDQQSTQLNAVPAISIQDTQQRETLQQRNSLTDNRDSVSNARLDMTSQVQNIEISIAEFNQLSQKKNRTQGENAVLEQLKIAVPKLSRDLPILRQALGRLQASEANLPANDAKAIAALQEQQTYNLGKQKETEEQDRRATANTQLRGKLTDLDQQLTNAPLDQDKLKSQRELNKQAIVGEAEIARVNAERAITERGRSDASYYPKQQAGDRARVKAIEQNTVRNASNKQAQESFRAKNTIDQEFATADIAELKLGQSKGDLDVRFSQSQDKIDAPFASTRALDLELQQKLSAIENAKIERNKNFEQQRIKYAGTSEANTKLLASLDRQQNESDRQSEVEKKVVETDSGIAVRSVQSQRKGFLFGQQQSTTGQQISIYNAQTTGDKQRGQDTRDREYSSGVMTRQNETNKQVFELEQQRDAITGTGEKAVAARAHIDGLISGVKELASIELSNMADQFDRFNQVLGETQKTTQSVLEKFVKTGKFDWKAILRTPLEGGISQIMSQVTGSLFGGLYRKAPATNSPGLPDGTKPAESTDGGVGFIGNLFGFGGQAASNLQPTLQSQSTPSRLALPSVKTGQIADRVVSQPEIAQPKGRSILDADGMANIPMPGGGNYRVPREQAISEGFMRLDGSSTNQPEVKPEIKIAPLEPQTIAAPEVTIEPIAPQTITAPTDDTSFDVRQLPLKGRSNVVNFKPKFDPNTIVPPPMPVDQYEGISGYVAPKQQQRSSGGDALGLLGMIPGLGGAGKYMGLLGKLGGLFGLGFADGGLVPKDSKFGEFRQGDDPIGAALRKEGSNSVIAALTPGERVLTLSESRYYETMFPQGIKGYADGGIVGNIKPIPLNLDQSKIDNRGDSNEFNFDIKNGGGNDAKMTKDNVKELENAVVAVLLKQKRARTGLVSM